MVGLLAVLEGELVSDQLASPTVQHICHRFERDGLLATASGPGQLRLALAALNQRLRYALGEFNGPIEPPTGKSNQYFGFTTRSAADDFIAAALGNGERASQPQVYDQHGYDEPVSWQVVISTTELPLTRQFDDRVRRLTMLAQQLGGFYGRWGD